MTTDPLASNAPTWRRDPDTSAEAIRARRGLQHEAAEDFWAWAAEARAADNDVEVDRFERLARSVEQYRAMPGGLGDGAGYRSGG